MTIQQNNLLTLERKRCGHCKTLKAKQEFPGCKTFRDGLYPLCAICKRQAGSKYYYTTYKSNEPKYVDRRAHARQQQLARWDNNRKHNQKLTDATIFAGTKLCRHCQHTKPGSEFTRCHAFKGGLDNFCKTCRHAVNRRRYLQLKASPIGREYLKRQQQKQVQREKLLGYPSCKRYLAKPDTRAKRSRHALERHHNDIQFKLANNLRSRIRTALHAHRVSKRVSAVQDLGCSMPDFIQHLETQFQPGMSWANYGNKSNCWSLDHIIPLSKFDLTDKGCQQAAVHYTNLQPLWHRDNARKWAH